MQDVSDMRPRPRMQPIIQVPVYTLEHLCQLSLCYVKVCGHEQGSSHVSSSASGLCSSAIVDDKVLSVRTNDRNTCFLLKTLSGLHVLHGM